MRGWRPIVLLMVFLAGSAAWGETPAKTRVKRTAKEAAKTGGRTARDGAEPGGLRGAVEERNRGSDAVERDGRPGIDGRQLLEDDRPHEGADVCTDEPQRRELPDQLGRHTAVSFVRPHARQEAILRETSRRLLDEPLLLGEGEREAHAGFFGGSETRSVPCATQASWSPFVTSTRTTAVRRPSATTVDSATTVPARTGAR